MSMHKVADAPTMSHSRLQRVVSATLPTRAAPFRIFGYESPGADAAHIAMVLGEVASASPVLVRIHSECFTGEVFGSLRCDCRSQLDMALAVIAAAGQGAIVYLRGHEGRGIGLINKLRAYALQDTGVDTVCANTDLGLPVDARDYLAAVNILNDLGVRRIRLMTNNPDKIAALEAAGLTVVERVPLVSPPNATNAAYLQAKQARLGHLLEN
jgi:3,4-dihydroxy 2-butanone 4-phosphate synthase/GTP cyclohydrolase II